MVLRESNPTTAPLQLPIVLNINCAISKPLHQITAYSREPADLTYHVFLMHVLMKIVMKNIPPVPWGGIEPPDRLLLLTLVIFRPSTAFCLPVFANGQTWLNYTLILLVLITWRCREHQHTNK